MEKTSIYLKRLISVIENSVKKIEWSNDEDATIQELKNIMQHTDKQYSKIIRDIGGNELMFEDTNQTSFELAIGEIQ